MKLKTRQRKFLREATIMLAVAQVAVRAVAVSQLVAWANRPSRRVNRFSQGDVDWVRWAVEDIGGRPWMKALCVPRALAAQWMLRRRGIASRLCLDVAGDGDVAHLPGAWIELSQGVIDIDGCEVTPTVTRSIVFGGNPA
jgi:hypothetical protein